MAPERDTVPTDGPGRGPEPLLAAATAPPLPARSGDSTPPAGDDGPSREEVQRRIAALYDLAENDTGTFNATRARAASGTRSGGGGQPATALGAVARQWFDVARARLGPSAPAVLPARRSPARPARRAPAPAAGRGAPEPTGRTVPAPALPEARPGSGEQRRSASPEAAKRRTQRRLAAARALLPARAASARPAELTAPARPAHAVPGLAPAPAPGFPPATPGAFRPVVPPEPAVPPVTVPAGHLPSATADPLYDGKAAPAVAFARAQVGKPCVWGATGPDSYDGASLVRAAWRAAGVTLPRAARDQALAGTPVSLAAARPGDLVFFHDTADHVGLCTGEGTVIHAPGPGAYIREEPLDHIGPDAVDGVVRPS
jgi:cell wall-associated NlpC family hydrolase